MVAIDKEKISPICPHCEQKIDRVIMVNRGAFSIYQVFCCPKCEKVLGVGGAA